MIIIIIIYLYIINPNPNNIKNEPNNCNEVNVSFNKKYAAITVIAGANPTIIANIFELFFCKYFRYKRFDITEANKNVIISIMIVL